MKKTKQILAVIAATVLTAGALAGCGNQPDSPSDRGSTDGESGKLSGSIAMAGSTSMEKMVNAMNEAFMEKNRGVTITSEFIGSGAGVESTMSGRAQIANVSRNLADSEKEAGMVENIVAIDGIAMVVNKANEAENLTKQQVADIYTGKISNWKELGGSDHPIVVIGREASSGTREAFETIVEVEKCAYSNELDNTGAVMAKVSATEGAIGYVSLDVVDDSVKALNLEGVEPTASNIKSGGYFLSRPFVMATKGSVENQSELVKKYFEFLKSEEGKKVIEQAGLITVD